MVSALSPWWKESPTVPGGLHGDLVVTGGPDGVNAVPMVTRGAQADSAVPKVTGRSPRCQQDLRVTEVSPW